MGIAAVGDMVASIGTILIPPDDHGDMAQYLESLERLRLMRLRMLIPAHGAPIEDPDEKLAEYIRHRLLRERQVIGGLQAMGTATPMELVPGIYTELPTAFHPLAAQSLIAHLHKLEKEGRAQRLEASTGPGVRWALS